MEFDRLWLHGLMSLSRGSRNFERGEWARNMKYKPPCMTAIFFMTIFYRRGGGMALLLPPPLDPLLSLSS